MDTERIDCSTDFLGEEMVHKVPCLKCGNLVSENNRTQLCRLCRVMKCRRHGCEQMIPIKTYGDGYCRKHRASVRKKSEDGLFDGWAI